MAGAEHLLALKQGWPIGSRGERQAHSSNSLSGVRPRDAQLAPTCEAVIFRGESACADVGGEGRPKQRGFAKGKSAGRCRFDQWPDLRSADQPTYPPSRLPQDWHGIDVPSASCSVPLTCRCASQESKPVGTRATWQTLAQHVLWLTETILSKTRFANAGLGMSCSIEILTERNSNGFFPYGLSCGRAGSGSNRTFLLPFS